MNWTQLKHILMSLIIDSIIFSFIPMFWAWWLNAPKGVPTHVTTHHVSSEQESVSTPTNTFLSKLS